MPFISSSSIFQAFMPQQVLFEVVFWSQKPCFLGSWPPGQPKTCVSMVYTESTPCRVSSICSRWPSRKQRPTPLYSLASPGVDSIVLSYERRHPKATVGAEDDQNRSNMIKL